MNRRAFLHAAGAAAAAAQNKKRTNVVVLFSDDQRFDTIHALGNPEIKTPNLDRLAHAGTAFTRAAIMGGTHGAVCVPSRGMLLTGQTLFHVHDNIIAAKPGPSARPFHMFPEVFRKAGYTTFGVGKWHNGPALYHRCFDGGGPVMFGGMSDHWKVPVADYDPTGEYKARHPGGKHSSELFTDAAVNFLNGAGDENPFLLYLAYTAPHDPRTPPKEYAAMYPPDKISLPKNFMPQHPFDNGELKVRDETLADWPRTPGAIQRHIADYYAMITHLDAQIGRVLQALEKTGRMENTVIVFAGDNGLALGRHGLLGKQSVYEHSVRVPLILSGPGISRGQRSDAMCYLLDVFPTLCDLTGVGRPATVEGSTLMPALKNPKTPLRESLFHAYRGFQRAVNDGRWKLIRYRVGGKETTQLFDLRTDPWEMKNLAEDPAHGARVKEMENLLREWMKKTDDPGWGAFGS